MDVLTDVLRALELRGTVYFEATFKAPWGMEMAAGSVANFHVITSGSCWLRVGTGQPVKLEAGSLVVLPHGDTHSLAHAPDAPLVAAPELLAAGHGEGAEQVFGGAGEPTMLLCGHFECDRSGAHPLIASLPTCLHLSAGTTDEPAWFETVTRLAAAESQAGRPGGAAVVDRLAEVLLVQVLRSAVEQSGRPVGFMAALGDERLQPALAAIHQQASHPWTVALLAEKASMSRAAFAEHFRSLIGLAPMQYVTQWRMQRARHLLGTTDQSTAQIAEHVGYTSEWAFARAFKRMFGEGPGAARRAARA